MSNPQLTPSSTHETRPHFTHWMNLPRLAVMASIALVLVACSPTPVSVPPTADPMPAATTEATAEATSQATDDEILLVTGEFPPLTSESMAGGGLSAEIVEAVFAEMGRPMRIEFYPWERAEAMVESGEAWGAFPYVPTADRQARFLTSNPISRGETVFYYYDDAFDSVEYTELSELQPYTIGVSLGYWYIDVLTQAGLTTEEASDDLANLRKLQAGRIQLFPMYEPVAVYTIQQNFPDDAARFRTLDTPMSTDDDTVIASRVYPDSETLMADFNAALATVQASPAYAALFERYGLEPISTGSLAAGTPAAP